MRIFFSVGEPSGDLHGANLVTALKQRQANVECVGFGGPRMRDAGCELHEELTQYAVMWFSQVIAKLPFFVKLLRRADQYFVESRPDAVVLIDYPGFNWWIARRAKAHGIPVFYFGAPQLWAWAGWRVRKMRRLTDHVLCKLPFEETWFRQRGCNAHYVGHPYFDELHQRELDHGFIASINSANVPVLTLLPGSRRQEVERNLPCLLKAAEVARQDMEEMQVFVASFDQAQAEIAQRIQADLGTQAEIQINRTPELIHLADCCVACSGSVSLELMYHRKPSVIHYKVGKIGFFLQQFFRTARYITLVNLLATTDIERRAFQKSEAYDGSVPFPEFLTCRDESAAVGKQVLAFLSDDAASHKIANRLDTLCASYGQPGASQRAAEYIWHELASIEDFPAVGSPHRRSRHTASAT